MDQSQLRRVQSDLAALPVGNGKPPQKAPQHVIDSLTAKSYAVVKGQIPPELLSGLMADFSEDEVEKIYARVNKTLAPSHQERPQALFVFGPSAVGKSTLGGAKASAFFGCTQNAVVIDGAEFREQHAGFQAVTMHGHEHGLLHADAWSIFKDAGKNSQKHKDNSGAGHGWSGALKQRIFADALRDRQNLLIPDCANHVPRLSKMIEEVRRAGYGLHAVCLWAPLSMTRQRGEERAVREGKLWTPKEYVKMVRGELAIAMRWIDGMRDEPGVYCSLELWDNSHFPAVEVGLETFASLVYMTDDDSAAHAARRAAEHKNEHTQAACNNVTAIGKLREGQIIGGGRLSFVGGSEAFVKSPAAALDVLTMLEHNSNVINSFTPATAASLPPALPLPGPPRMVPVAGHSHDRARKQGRLEGIALGALLGVLLGGGLGALSCAAHVSALMS